MEKERRNVYTKIREKENTIIKHNNKIRVDSKYSQLAGHQISIRGIGEMTG